MLCLYDLIYLILVSIKRRTWNQRWWEQSLCYQHIWASRGCRCMRSTQKAKQEVAIGNISSKFFRLRISKTTLLMNPIVILLKPIQSISFFFFFSFLVLLFPQGQNFLRFLACDRLEKKTWIFKPFMVFFSLIFIGICCWVQSLL